MQVRLNYREPRIIEREPDAPDNLTQREPKSAMIASPAADNLKPLHVRGASSRAPRRFKFRLPLKSILKGNFENENRQKSVIIGIYLQTDDSERTLILIEYSA